MTDTLIQRLGALIPRMRRFATALTGSAADAEDLVQMTCERALNRSEQLRQQDRADAWLYGIMRNLWVDEIRSRRVRRHEDVDAAAELAGDDGPATTEARLTLARVRQVLAALSADHRSVLVLVCVDGLSYREAADVLGVALGTVMSRLARARLELHARLGERSGTVTPFRPRDDRLGNAGLGQMP